MWLEKLLPHRKVDRIQTLTDAIRELSGLIRIDLQQRGVSSSSVPRQFGKVRKRTANDVSVLTRQDVWEQQQAEEIERELALKRPESSPRSPSDPESASPLRGRSSVESTGKD